MELDNKRAPVANNTMKAAEWICPNLTLNGNIRAEKLRFGIWNLATFTTPLYRCIDHYFLVAVLSSFCFLPDSAGKNYIINVLSQQKCNWRRGCQLGTSQVRKLKVVKFKTIYFWGPIFHLSLALPSFCVINKPHSCVWCESLCTKTQGTKAKAAGLNMNHAHRGWAVTVGCILPGEKNVLGRKLRRSFSGGKLSVFMGNTSLTLGIWITQTNNPRCSIYGIFTYIYPQNNPNVGK